MGSAGGGGSGSGAVEYPAYIEMIHSDWLNHGIGVDTIDESVTDIMNASLGNSPFVTAAAYDPTTPISEIINAPDLLQTLVTLLSNGTGLDDLIENVLDETRITDSVTAFSTDLTNKADADIYPRFEAGMRDIGAVMGSAFVIGRANIAEKIVNDVAKYEGELRYRAWGQDVIQVIDMKLRYQQVVSQFIIEANRVKIVASKEQVDTDVKYDEADAVWDLSVFQYGANVMASVAGGTASPAQKQPSTAQSMIGGAMSGAAAGALVGSAVPGIGTLAGAMAGGALGAAGGLL